MLKTAVFVTGMAFSGGISTSILVDIYNLESPYQVALATSLSISVAPNASAGSMNSAIMSAVRSYASSNWGTTYGPSDTVRLMTHID